MNNPNWFNNYVWHPYTQEKISDLPLAIVAADGVRIKLADGRELIDGISSWWVMCHGHNHPYIKKTIKNQLDKLSHIMFAGIAHEPAYVLAEKLINILPKGLSKIFYSDSGSVSVEIALKIAIQFWNNMGRSEKKAIISFKNGYHGDTMGAMNVSDNPYHDKFNITNQDRYIIDLPHDEESLENLENIIISIRDKTAALIIEPLVQAAGGMKFHSSEILAKIYKTCKKNNILFIADEVGTGFGRTGTMFACEQSSITPDIICIGKALTGGFMSLAATIITDEIYQAFYSKDVDKAFMHGPTFMANPLACAAAIASIELFEQEIRLIQVKNIEKQLEAELSQFRKYPNIKDVRVKGAIGVVEFEPGVVDVYKLRKEFIKHNIWLRPFGNIIYIMPPFTISKDDLSVIIKVVDDIIR